MNVILTIPIEARLAVAVRPRGVRRQPGQPGASIGWHGGGGRSAPGRRPTDRAPPRRLVDRVPIFGWLGLRREAALHGPGFWIRPMLVELGRRTGLCRALWWEIVAAGLLPAGLPGRMPRTALSILHYEFFSHLTLISLMLAASLIDCDEKTIPDAITVPGTLAGPAAGGLLSLGRCCPYAGSLPGQMRFSISCASRPPQPRVPPLVGGLSQRVSLADCPGLFLGWCAALSAPDLAWAARLAAGDATLPGAAGPQPRHLLAFSGWH